MAVTAPRTESPAQPALAPFRDPNSVVAPSSVRATGSGRIEFLDGLRGIAALTVAVQHGAEQVWPGYLRWSETVFRPGEFGVILFFIISGFIIPASLERYGSLGRFWISRVFRLFPLYWAALLAIAFFAFVIGTFQLPPDVKAHPLMAFGINATMLTDFITPPPILGQAWSLAYEVSFYAMVSVFFLCAVHRRSVHLAIGWLVAAVIIGGTATVLGILYQHGITLPKPFSSLATITALPARLLGHITLRNVVVGAITVVVLTAVISMLARLTVRRTLLVFAICAVFVPLVLNRPEPLYFATLLFMSMFVGTVQFRWIRGAVSGRVALAVFLGGMAVTALVLRWEIQPHVVPGIGGVATWHTEALTFLGAYAVFGAGLLLRNCTVPRLLLWLGTISYSLYLVHVIVYYDTPWWGSNQVLTLLRWLAISLVVASLTYLFIERPFQHWGHAIAKRGLPDRRPAVAARLG